MIVRHLGLAGRGLVTVLLGVNVLLGLLPVAFIVATSVVVGQVPAAVVGGADSSAWGDLVRAFLAASVLFLAQQLLVPAQVALGELVKRRVDGHMHDRIMAVALASPGIGPMEDQAALDALQEASRGLEGNWETPGMACSGMLALTARYVRLVGLAVLVGVVVSWPAAAALVAATMIFRYGNRGGLRKYSQAWGGVVGIFRHATYLRDVALHSSAAKELRVFGLTPWLAERYAERYRAWLAPVWRARRRIYLFPYLAYTAIGLVVAVGTVTLVARAGAGGDLTLTEFVLALQATVGALLLGTYYPESDDVTQLGMLAATGLSRFEKAVGAAQARPDVPGGAGSAEVPVDPAAVPEPSVRFESVVFRYAGSHRTVLDGLDFELPAGRCTAVVGVNGAGKTTIVKLLSRLYEPGGGAIRFGGVDIRRFDVEAWRQQLSAIFQDFVRYELSVADNIAFGAPHAPRDPDLIRRVAERAGILDVIDSLPGGLDTPLHRAYPGGIDLSGGQWQRIAIARSLFAVECGARVLVLDEPTAALDVRAEARFFEQFVALTQGVTSLLISHRFSSVRHADNIVVVDGGRMVERGSHDSLLAAEGRYAELFRLQAERFARGLDADGDIVDTDPALADEWR